MAINYIGNDTDGADAVTLGDIWIVQSFAILSNTSDAFDFGTWSGNTLVVEGSVISELDGVDSDIGSGGNEVVVAVGGLVLGQSDGIEMAGSGHTVTVNGEVFAGGDNGVEFDGDFNYLENNGSISGSFAGIGLFGNDNTVQNKGSVSGNQAGLWINDSGNSVSNSGSIVGSIDAVNINSSPGDTNLLINSGTLSGGSGNAVSGGTGVEVILNSGSILGTIQFLSGNDIYDGRRGEISDTVNGGADNDTLLGGDGDETLIGESGSDRLSGGGGDDEMVGGSGADQIFGGQGDDDLDGGSSGDTLIGGYGDDTLLGGNGADTLVGGRDDDMLTGGGGADIFVFKPSAGSDRITDFEDGLDRIDLTAFGLRPALFNNVVEPLLTNAGGATSLDLADLGGSGILLIEGLSFGNADASDFIL